MELNGMLFLFYLVILCTMGCVESGFGALQESNIYLILCYLEIINNTSIFITTNVPTFLVVNNYIVN